MNLMETETFDKVDINKRSFDNNNDLKKLNQNMDTSPSSQTLSKCSINENGFKFYTNSVEGMTATKTTNNIIDNNNMNLDFYENISSYNNAKDIQKNDQSATNARSNTFTFLNRQTQSVSIPSKVISDINQINQINPSQYNVIKKDSMNNHLFENNYQSMQFCSNKKDITDVNNVNESAFKYDISSDTNNCNNLNKNELNNESIKMDNTTNPETINIIDKIKKTNEDLSRYCDTKKLFFRNEDQENAFRRIEDVHNYAKLNHFNYTNGMNVSSSNSSNQDDDDEDDDEEVDDEDDVNDGEDNDDESDDAEVVDYANNNEDKIVNRRFHVTKPSKFKKTYPKNDYRVTAGGKKMKQKQISVCHKNYDKMITNNLLTRIKDNSTLTPDHHARRPMNAFLIFCKRHRGIVREKYKNLENRSITKVLGDWWASLDIYDKDCYTLLAKEYKDAFFNANPNFKWYKLPAPPLRTLNTRPSNGERFLDLPNSEFEQSLRQVGNDDITSDIEQNNQWNNNPHPNPDVSDKSMIGGNVNVFKLADETQLGGLSILLNKKKFDKHSIQKPSALQKTMDFVESPVDNITNKSCGEPFENMKDHALKLSKTETTIRRDQSFSSSEDDNLSTIEKTTSRSCKGKKYQEFISSGQIGVVAKKPKIEKMVTNKINKSDSSGDSSDQKPITKKKQSIARPSFVKDSKTILVTAESPPKFNTISFDLEEKINSLPALNLEEYLQRKRNTKTKKKTNLKRRVATPAVVKATSNQQYTKTAQEVKESLQIVGSKKRKARKESITRRDLNTVQNDTKIINNFVFDSIPKQVELNNDNITATVLADSHCNANNDNLNNNNNSSTSDLLILAEVATNHFEIK